MGASNQPELKALIAEALAAGMSDNEIAVLVIRDRSELFRAWAKEKLEALIRSEIRKMPDPRQLAFPFPDLSVRLPMKTGFVEMREATIGKLKQAERVLEQRRTAAARNPGPKSVHGRLRRLIEGMQPYAMANTWLTVEKYYDLVRDGVPPPPSRKSDATSERMRRYWAGLSDEQRHALGKKMARKTANTRVGRR